MDISILMLKIMEHVKLTFTALIISVALGFSIGILTWKYVKLSNLIIHFANFIQAIPSLAFLTLMVPLFGLGDTPATIALIVRALMPIIRNTYVGIREINPAIIEAAEGMGMTEMQILIKVRLPLALPVIMAGIRTAGVLLVGIATIASLIGAGGLGEILFLGITSMNTDFILAGAIPVAFLAVITEVVLGQIEKAFIPKGLKK
ncbi:MAG: ABC transporter permease [archaeon YNP-LCB-003-016]|jgi:osmoprotectant transport system permease protein|uniref:ABC transporter permease n=1 Tax=Candidatus Culexarchaeum yellowstonense TaxID=2928963 RepID=UPI0026F31200|nr:ABC transporter permease [Candidatus Culexarchaeum yellowstonense]MCR6691773.1 ABC transporter permease [Candidatus Culexarchaeum yellowstonense]